MASYKEQCVMVVDSAPGTGNVTIREGVPGQQALGISDDGQVFVVLIRSIDAIGQQAGGLWEVHNSTWTNSTKILSRSSGTVVDGSSGPGTLVNFATGTQWATSLYRSSGATGSAGGDLTGSYPNPTIASGVVTEAKLSTSDVTTANVSTTKHGFVPKAPNDATKYLDGTGAYSTPASAGSAGGDLTGSYPNPTIASGVVTEAKLSTSDVTTANVSTTKHGFTPKAPNDATKYLDGTAAYSTPAAAGSAGGDLTGSYPNPTIKSGVHLTGQVQIDAHFGTLQSDTDGATVTFDMSVADKHTVTLGGTRTLAVSNDQTGQAFLVTLVQDSPGSRTVTWWSGIKWPSGTTPVLTTTANKADVFSFLKTGAGAYYGFTVGQNL